MTVALGVMGVPAPQDGDSIRRYETGTLPDGGLWTALRRLSDHDHTGGENGTPISVASIPDGSITTGKLDPSVLAPYSLVDGSKPFTGQVTMQQDAIVRDALYFGQQGTALAPDVTLTRTAAGVLTLTGELRGTGNVWAQTGLLMAGPTAATPTVAGRTRYYHDGGAAQWESGIPGTAASREYVLFDMAAAATPLRVAAATGTVTLTPAAGNPALTAQGVTDLRVPAGVSMARGYVAGTQRVDFGPTGTLTLTPAAGAWTLTSSPAGGTGLSLGKSTTTTNSMLTTGGAWLEYNGGALVPNPDNAVPLGWTNARWTTVYAVAGTINTSSREAKQDITPLDPAAALAAVLHTDPVTFDYKTPARPPALYRRDSRQKVDVKRERDRLRYGPLEAAARHQAGFVAEQAAPLLLTGEGQTNAAHTAGILLAALHEIDRRLTALEEGTP